MGHSIFEGQRAATVNRVGARLTTTLAQSNSQVSRREESGQLRRKRRKAVSSDKEFDEKTVRSFNN